MWIWSFRYKDKKSLVDAIKYMKTELGWKVKMYKEISAVLKSFRINILPEDRDFIVFRQMGSIDLKKQSLISSYMTSKLPTALLTNSQQEALKKGLVGALSKHFSAVPKKS